MVSPCLTNSSGCLEFDPISCANATCSFDVGLAGLPNKRIPPSREVIEHGLVELGIRGIRTAAAGDLSIVVTLADGSRFRTYGSDGFPLRPRDTEFRVAQVPLGQLRKETVGGPGPALDLPALEACDGRISGISVVAPWTPRAVLGFDRALIRY